MGPPATSAHSSSALRMFWKLQRLLSQQAVLIKTMFHLFLMIINCPCNEKKKKFSARKIIPPCGQTDSSQIGICAHFSGIWKILPLAGHTDFYSPSPRMLMPKCSHYLQISKGLAELSLRKNKQPSWKWWLSSLKKKNRDFQKRCSCFCPLVPPSCYPS